jgi:acetamidase/formamidase
MPTTYQLDDADVHYAWDNKVSPRLSVDPGDTVVVSTRDAADHYYNAASTHADCKRKGPLTGHPMTGPIAVRGARPGDALAITILDVVPSLDFGWTAIRPGKGLLPEQEFPRHHLQIWDLSDGAVARMPQRDDIAIPFAPFPGIVGTALARDGAHSTIPPRENGGNMDLKHLTRGSVLWLPVWVDEALVSIGDAHAAQGDGEVCVTAIEMSARVTVKIDLLEAAGFNEPRLRTAGPLCAATNTGPHFATTAHGPDLYECAQSAVRQMIDHLVTERDLSREEAYILCSVTVDLKINEIVDAPNWIVSAFLPESVFA